LADATVQHSATSAIISACIGVSPVRFEKK
jgi:hypothetical protein